jgi:quinol monooxygenase YgiN
MTDKNQSRREFVATAAGAAALTAAFGFNRVASAQDTSTIITQVVRFKVKEGQEEAAAATLAKLAKDVEEKEPGVLAYIAHFTKDDPKEVVFFEVYKDAEALAEHGRMPHLAELRTKFMELFQPPLNIQQLEKVGGFMRG